MVFKILVAVGCLFAVFDALKFDPYEGGSYSDVFSELGVNLGSDATLPDKLGLFCSLECMNEGECAGYFVKVSIDDI